MPIIIEVVGGIKLLFWQGCSICRQAINKKAEILMCIGLGTLWIPKINISEKLQNSHISVPKLLVWVNSNLID